MMGFPLAYTSGTKGKVVCPAVIAADIQTKKDLDRYKGKLKGAVVLSTPPVHARHGRPDAGRFAPDRGRAEADRRDRHPAAAARPDDAAAAQSRPRQGRGKARLLPGRRRRRGPPVHGRPDGDGRRLLPARGERGQVVAREDPQDAAHHRGDAGALQPDVPHPQARHPGQGRGRGPQPRRRQGREGLERPRRDPGHGPRGRGRHARGALRQLARGLGRERHGRRLRRGPRSGPHPQGHRGQAPADDPRRLLGRRGAGPPRLARVRQRPLRQPEGPEDRGQARTTRSSRSISTRTTAPASSAASTSRRTSGSAASSRPGWSRSGTSA